VLAVLAMLGPACLRVAVRRCARCELRSQPGQLLCAAAVRWGSARAWGAGGTMEHRMLRIYPVLLELVRSVAPLVRQLERRDADLARQCRRALSSAPLNIAEGSYSRGGNRRLRYQTALGSLREALACFETAAALGYLPDVDAELRGRFDHVLGTLVRLVGGH
jgi:four helix bundle protein